MVYFIYDLLLFVAALIYLPVYALRGRVHKKILTRLGWGTQDIEAKVAGHKDVIWIHAVSVGEARAVESLARLIRRQWPQDKMVVSTVTPTGYAILAKFLKPDELVFYAPLDTSWVVARFIRILRPRLLLVMETEIWPNLIRLNAARGARVIIVNGRISDKSFRGYSRMKWFLRPILKKIDLFCMQSTESAGRIRVLGVPESKLRVTGNIKFDLDADMKEPLFFSRLQESVRGQLLWVAGSTHDNEEEMLLSIYRSLARDFKNLKLILAPRHLERIDKIKKMLRFNGFEPAFLSRLNVFSGRHVGLLDTMGDLSALYHLADIVFIGGSLVKKGGHNPIEPAIFGKPVLFGPFMDNFREIRDIFLKEKAAVEVPDLPGLEYEMRRLLGDPSQRVDLGQRGKRLLTIHRGAAERTMAHIRGLS